MGLHKKIYINGIDADGTPTTFINKLLVRFPENQIREFPLKNFEPFVFDLPTSETMNLSLIFMGHYNEPNLAIAHTFPDGDLGATINVLNYTPITGLWKTDKPTHIPNKFLKSLNSPFKITIGNTHAEIAPLADADPERQNSHKWAMFITSDSDVNLKDFIDDVTYRLHPTFMPKSCTVTDPPYAIDRIGWGTFQIGIDIKLKSGQLVQLQHNLKFKDVHKKTYIIQAGVATRVESTQVDLPVEKITISADDKGKHKIDD